VIASQLRQAGFLRGVSFAKDLPPGGGRKDHGQAAEPPNVLRDYFEAHKEGPGMLKWLHYFEIYDRHLARFVGKDVHIVEIGVYSGGSLGMWRTYFGPRSRITGVDIMPECKVYENEFTKIEIGDQSDRSFWKRFRDEHPSVDIVIDDGGHTSEQQMVTLEELLPHLAPGGVYICEDVHTPYKVFTSFVSGLDDGLNMFDLQPVTSDGDVVSIKTTPLQSQIHSIHHYPYVVVLEKHKQAVDALRLVRHGTEWQPRCG
jgi:hypothetical protein